MALRDYLDGRERELLDELAALRAQIEGLQAELVPKEAELSEVRRAKGAIGMAGGTVALSGSVRMGASGGGAISLSFSSHQQDEVISYNVAELPAHLGSPSDTSDSPFTLKLTPSPYSAMTMKELVVKVLREHFHSGATTRQMLDFFRDAWGRDIERTNLSPQLSRLYQEAIIGRAHGRKEWYLMRSTTVARSYKPYVLRHTGEVNWVPSDATPPDDWLPILPADKG